MEIKTTIQSYLLIHSYLNFSMLCYAQHKNTAQKKSTNKQKKNVF